MKCLKRLQLMFGVLLAGACGGANDAPTQQIAESQAAIRAATEVGADSEPQAALHLKMAKDRMNRAEALNAKGDYAEASALVDEARADAELALSLTREQSAKQRAEQAEKQTQSIQSVQ